MWEAVNTFDNLEVDPAIPYVVGEVVFGDELLRDVVDADSDVFWAVEGGA